MRIAHEIDWAQLRSLDMTTVLERLGAERARQRHKWSCPVCGSSDALHLYPRDNRAHCYAEGEGYNPLDLLMAAEGLDALEAARHLSGWFGLELHGPPTRPPQEFFESLARARAQASQNSSEADAIEVCAAALDAEVWALLEGLEPTDEARAWLTTRGLSAEVAWELGCRDVAPALGALAELLNEAGAEVTRAAQWRTSQQRPYGPIAGLRRGCAHHAGLAIPAWPPGAKAPRGWRWRYYQPGRFKSYTVGAGILGAALPPSSTLCAPSAARVLFVCEGEPDWLSIHEVAHAEGLRHVSAVGLCSGLPRDLGAAIGTASPALVILAIHRDTEDGAELERSRNKRRRALGALAEAFPHAQVEAARVPGHHDLNDQRQRGTLTAWVHGVLEAGEVAR